MKVFKVNLTSLSRQDIQLAESYYRAINPKLAFRFIEALYEMYEALTLRPHVHARRYKDVRVAQLR